MSVPLPPPLPPNPETTLEERAHSVYQTDFGASVEPTQFMRSEIHVNRAPHPANTRREHTYWHMVTEGNPETQRVSPVKERLVKIPWVHPILKHADDPDIKVWFSPREANKHYCVWHSNANYLVILKQLRHGWLLKTTYRPDPERVAKLHQEYARSKRV